MSEYKEFQETEQMKNKIRQLKRLVKEMSAFDDKSCWNTSVKLYPMQLNLSVHTSNILKKR